MPVLLVIKETCKESEFTTVNMHRTDYKIPHNEAKRFATDLYVNGLVPMYRDVAAGSVSPVCTGLLFWGTQIFLPLTPEWAL